jgi:hypothetical protein
LFIILKKKFFFKHFAALFFHFFQLDFFQVIQPPMRTTWSPVLTAISTYGKGCALGTTATNDRFYDRDYVAEKRRKKQFLEHVMTNVQKVTCEECTPVQDKDTPNALRKCNNFANGQCMHGSKCQFSHAPPKPFTEGPYVEAKVYFASLDLADLNKEQLWKLAEQFGEVKTITFNQTHNTAQVAGSIYMTNEEAAKALAEELNYKTFYNNNRRQDQRKRYTRAKLEWVTNAVRTTSFKKMDKDAFISIDKKNVEQLEADARMASMLQLQYDNEVANNSATSPIPHSLSKSDWPEIKQDAVVEVDKTSESAISNTWQTVKKSAKTRRLSLVPSKMADIEPVPKPILQLQPELVLTQKEEEKKEEEQEQKEEEQEQKEETYDDTPSTPPMREYRKSLVLVDWKEFHEQRLKDKELKENKKAVWQTVTHFYVAENTVLENSDLVVDGENDDEEKEDNEDEEASEQEEEEDKDYYDPADTFEYYTNMAKSLLSKRALSRFNM